MKKEIDPRVSMNTQKELTEPAPTVKANKWFRKGSITCIEEYIDESLYLNVVDSTLESYAEWRLRMIRLGCTLLVSSVKVSPHYTLICGIAADASKTTSPRFTFAKFLKLAKNRDLKDVEVDNHDSKSD